MWQKFLVLSGGLGRSPYIFDRIKQEFKQNEHPQCSQMQIFQANTPQLAVVKGLVHDRRQWYLTDGCSSVFTHRIAPWSYGIHCRVRITKELYIRDEEKEKIVPDPYRPGEQFLTGRIEWIIKKVRQLPTITESRLTGSERQGDEVSTECAWEERFTRTLAPGSTDRLFVDEFVVSDDDPKNLPRSMSSKGVHKLCELQSNLKIVAEKDFKEIGNRWWSRTKHHFEIRHSIRIVLGPNDTQFELLFNNKVFGRTATDSGLIHWDPVGKTKKPNVENTPELRDLK
jgi:hypothetical protein